jgi:hypothetical protein
MAMAMIALLSVINILHAEAVAMLANLYDWPTIAADLAPHSEVTVRNVADQVAPDVPHGGDSMHTMQSYASLNLALDDNTFATVLFSMQAKHQIAILQSPREVVGFAAGPRAGTGGARGDGRGRRRPSRQAG